MKLFLLQPGDHFQIPSLKDYWSNMVVLRVNDSSVHVRGQNKDSLSEGWKHISTYFAPSTEVLFTGERSIVHMEGESVVIPHAPSGRKAKNAIEFPEGEFAIRDVVNKLQLPYHTVMNAFNRQREDFVEVRKEPNGGKGKPLIIWKKRA